jgi:hypothetical protein
LVPRFALVGVPVNALLTPQPATPIHFGRRAQQDSNLLNGEKTQSLTVALSATITQQVHNSERFLAVDVTRRVTISPQAGAFTGTGRVLPF